ncbi:MAG: alginate O-acetyltransferase AlgX-related protein [Roseimicrobium sp.]
MNLPVSVMLEKMPAFEEMRDLLAPFGVQLIVVPVPSAYGIHPERVPGLSARLMPTFGDGHQQLRVFGAELRRRGIVCVDLSEALRAAALQGSLCYFHRDSHWSPIAAQIGAEQVAPLLTHLAPLNPAVGWTAGEAEVLELPSRSPPTRMRVRVVHGETLSEDSAITVLADSNGLEVFDSPEEPTRQLHCGFASQLAWVLREPVDLVYYTGGGPFACRADFIRRCTSKANYLSRKRVVIWLLAERALAQPMETWPQLGLKRLTPPQYAVKALPPLPSKASFRLLRASEMIQPEATPYANVTRAFLAEMIVLDGAPLPVVLWLDHIRERRLLSGEGLQPGAVITAEVLPIEEARAKIPHLQIAQHMDDLGNYTDPVLYVVRRVHEAAP